jgi:hypothetical protein
MGTYFHPYSKDTERGLVGRAGTPRPGGLDAQRAAGGPP